MAMMRHKSFAVFILTYGRPAKVVTLRMLRRQHYTGPVYLVVEDIDLELEEYRRRYKDKVIVFSKKDAGKFDMVYNQPLQSSVWARNTIPLLAGNMGLEAFLELDDDYQSICWRVDDKGHVLEPEKKVKDLDRLFDTMLDYYLASPLAALCLAQSGDFIGGAESLFAEGIKARRKAMNAYFLSPERPFQFPGPMNEDVSAYVRQGAVGMLFLTTNQVFVHQSQTQAVPGGMTDLYRALGTYFKSFLSLIQAPSAVRVEMRGWLYPRLHHTVLWRRAVPKLLAEKAYKE